MAKQGMKRPEYTRHHPKNEYPPVPRVRNASPYDNDLAEDNLTQDIPDADLQDL